MKVWLLLLLVIPLVSCQSHKVNRVILQYPDLTPITGAIVRLESTASGNLSPIAITNTSDSSGVATFEKHEYINSYSYVIVTMHDKTGGNFTYENFVFHKPSTLLLTFRPSKHDF